MKIVRVISSAVALAFLAVGSFAATADELTDPFRDIGGIKAAFRGAALTNGEVAQLLEFRKTTTWEREKQI